ncbi:MAG: ribbon-helix-helix domain-containing protein [Paracoccaceae bacterium]|nr:ribbon-helix-helix domain-containing protein [Paracoccaceae bacterium]MDE3122260.1 ribbon-helix-helix domain-containing protein [Paracoccaceae bacterium]MDE3240779.1 ribbon-helix-helix domain-containing protein [Paracoccaceae bacterium]
MSGRPVKHSLTLRGHRTSVSLEDDFWAAFREIAEARGQGINALATEIDATRGDVGLASALRVFILREIRAQSSAPKA